MSDRSLKFAMVCYFLLTAAALQLTSCSFESWRAPMVLPPKGDTLQLAGFPAGGKFKFTGPVNITQQMGNHNVASSEATDNTKAGQRADAAAIGKGNSATSTPAGTPWWVYGICVLVGAGLCLWLRPWVMRVFGLVQRLIA